MVQSPWHVATARGGGAVGVESGEQLDHIRSPYTADTPCVAAYYGCLWLLCSLATAQKSEDDA